MGLSIQYPAGFSQRGYFVISRRLEHPSGLRMREGGEALEGSDDTMRKSPTQSGLHEEWRRMKLEGEQTLLRVLLRSAERYNWRCRTVEELLRRALARGLIGATVLEGEGGLDSSGQLVGYDRWSLVRRRLVVVEFLDAPAIIGAFLSDVASVVRLGTLMVERAHGLVFRRRQEQMRDIRPHLALPERVVPAAYLPSAQEFPLMRTFQDGYLLRIFIDDSDEWHGQPLYQAILHQAQQLGLHSLVILRAPLGYGTHRRVHSPRSVDYLTDLPILVEVVDSREQIERLLLFLEEAVPEGLVTIEGVKMWRKVET